MQNIAAVIFDMDGVIVDSERLHRYTEIESYKQVGIDITVEELDAFAGMPDIQTFREVLQANNKERNYDNTIFDYKYTKAVPAHLEQNPLVPIDGVTEVILAAAEKYPCAIASSAPRMFIDLVVEKLALEKYFSLRVSIDDVALDRGKPHPDIYLLTAEKLNVDPAQCLVIEDAAHGVAAAKAAGMMCIGFRSPHSGEQDLSAADHVVGHMEEILPLIETP